MNNVVTRVTLSAEAHKQSMAAYIEEGVERAIAVNNRGPVKFDAEGKKTANAKFLVVKLNGKVLHENVEMKGPTPSGVTGREAATGPIMF